MIIAANGCWSNPSSGAADWCSVQRAQIHNSLKLDTLSLCATIVFTYLPLAPGREQHCLRHHRGPISTTVCFSTLFWRQVKGWSRTLFRENENKYRVLHNTGLFAENWQQHCCWSIQHGRPPAVMKGNNSNFDLFS